MNAVETYFNNYKGVPSSLFTTSPAPLRASATLGQGEDSDSISGDDLMRFFADLSVSPEDIVTLAFAWKCGCKNVSEITRDEFKSGMKAMKLQTKAELKAFLRILCCFR